MTHEEHLERHLELCRRVYLRMLAEDSWPWKADQDSPKPEDVIESKNKKTDV